MDFGLRFLVGYDLPLGWNTGFMVQASYYLGLIDIYQSDIAKSDATLNQRSARFGLAYYVNLTVEKP